ncbi:MAG: glycosyltransferase [Bacteroidales bacterium]|nr:glycosyltransferase [Bacteroidales bacterium]
METIVRKKILVIPSWYPTEERPLEGTFFQEQALAMSELYDIRILYPEKATKNRFVRLLNTLKYILRIRPRIEFINITFTKEPKLYSFTIVGSLGILWFYEKVMTWEYNAAIEKVIKSGWKPDLIHAQSVVYGGIYSYFIALKHKIPYIITEHNVFLLSDYSIKVQRLIKSSLEHAKLVLAVSQHQQRMILMHGIKCKTQVIGNMIDEHKFYIAPPHHQAFTILFITYNGFIKDNETFLRAIKLFKQKSIHPFVVNVLGRTFENGISDYFISLVKDYDLSDCVELTGSVDRTQIVNYFQTSNVFVSTSIAETFGVSLCEALFCGVPIISTANGGVDDMIDKKNGVLVNIQDADAICEALIKISNKEIVFDPVDVRNTVIDKFGKKEFIKKMDFFYSSAMNEVVD